MAISSTPIPFSLPVPLPTNVYSHDTIDSFKAEVKEFRTTSASLHVPISRLTEVIRKINGSVDEGKRPAIYLDLDGVMVNFTTAAAVMLDNLKIPELPSGLVNFDTIDKAIASETVFNICSGREFWDNLDPYPWSWMLFEECFKLTQGNVYFVSRAFREDPDSWAGKAAWVHRHFGEYGLRHLFLMAGYHKHRFCNGPSDILIDDRLDNVVRWALAGGTGFHWEEIDARYAGAAGLVAERFTSLQALFPKST